MCNARVHYTVHKQPTKSNKPNKQNKNLSEDELVFEVKQKTNK